MPQVQGKCCLAIVNLCAAVFDTVDAVKVEILGDKMTKVSIFVVRKMRAGAH